MPQNIIIISTQTQLYRIGLGFESFDYVIRNKYYNPKIVFILILLSNRQIQKWPWNCCVLNILNDIKIVICFK